MKKIAFVVEHFGDTVGVITLFGENVDDIRPKLESAVRDNVEVDKDTVVHVGIGLVGDYGENTKVVIKYVNEGELIEDDEFVLRKTVLY